MPGRKYIPLDQIPPGSVDKLTTAQRAIVHLMAEGLELKEIAAELGRSHHTIRNQVWIAKARAGARTSWQLVALAVRAGIA